MANSTPFGRSTLTSVISTGISVSFRRRIRTRAHPSDWPPSSAGRISMNGALSMSFSRRSFHCHQKAIRPGVATTTDHAPRAIWINAVHVILSTIGCVATPMVRRRKDEVHQGFGLSACDSGGGLR